MEVMFLIDTNIFLEILLEQDKKKSCKKFLEDNIGRTYITDFSLHSIGVILFRYDKEVIFQRFVEDVIPNTKILSLPPDQYTVLVKDKKILGLDFDDAYQYCVAKSFGINIVTMDKDFERVKDVNVQFL